MLSEASEAAPRALPARGEIVNALSVDVEDYFQVGLFEDVISRGDWNHLELRVEANTLELMELFEDHGVRATFFVLGWVAEHCPGLVRAIFSISDCRYASLREHVITSALTVSAFIRLCANSRPSPQINS